ncbi:hypothetical protein [Phenylobacterium sp.]|uniref:hypothetical protein n=1 Tax=Phenylobacterium sp. TaxID=1871053 RepID=UPI00261B1CA0|nr:hypothetical protein [Phenylobacterium sp.]
MPDVDLSTLSAAELRDLLDSTRQRGQAAQSYQILQEMAERRNHPARSPAGRARVIALDFGDSLETFDGDPVRPEATAAPGDAPAEDAMDADLTLSLDERPPRRRKAPRASKPDRDPPSARPPQRRGFPILGFSVGVALGLVMGLGLGIQSRPPAPEPGAAVFPQAPALRPQPAAAPAATAAAGEPASPPAQTTEIDTAPIPGPPAPTAGTPTTAETAPPPAPAATPSAPTSAASETAGPAVEPAAPEIARPVQSAAAAPSSKACVNPPTPADRAICGDARLLHLQRELRAAYARALDAHSDRATLRQRQLAWADARNGVTDPDRLAELYEARIKRLDAATEAAKRGR